MTEHDDLEAMCEQLAGDIRSLPARTKRANAELQALIDAANKQKGQLALERSQHDRAIDESTAKHKAACAEREHGVRNREAALETDRRELEAERQRVSQRERWVENRASDLGNRERRSA